MYFIIHGAMIGIGCNIPSYRTSKDGEREVNFLSAVDGRVAYRLNWGAVWLEGANVSHEEPVGVSLGAGVCFPIPAIPALY